MDALFLYKFNKPFYSQSELLEIFGSLSLSTLKRYMSEWISAGNEVKEMGMFRLDGVRENQWEPTTFLKWLYENKINAAYKYDYQKVEQDNLKSDLNKLTNKGAINVKNSN